MNDTTHELTNRQIAERVGHKVHAYNDEPVWCDRIRDWLFEDWMEGDSEWDVREIPDYLHSADAALSLVEHLKDRFTLARISDIADGWEASIGSAERTEYPEFVAIKVADIPAEAIIRCWLAYQEARK